MSEQPEQLWLTDDFLTAEFLAQARQLEGRNEGCRYFRYDITLKLVEALLKARGGLDAMVEAGLVAEGTYEYITEAIDCLPAAPFKKGDRETDIVAELARYISLEEVVVNLLRHVRDKHQMPEAEKFQCTHMRRLDALTKS